MVLNSKEEEYIKSFLSKIKINEVMTSPVVTIFEDEELSEAEEKFVIHKIFYLPVLSREHRLVGLISHKYLYKTQSPRKFIDPNLKFDPEIIFDPDILVEGDSYYSKETLDSYILRSIMNKNPSTLKEDDTVANALLTLGDRNVGCIVIVGDSRKVVGLVTHREIVNLFTRILKG